jgi:hypothetical protein
MHQPKSDRIKNKQFLLTFLATFRLFSIVRNFIDLDGLKRLFSTWQREHQSWDAKILIFQGNIPFYFTLIINRYRSGSEFQILSKVPICSIGIQAIIIIGLPL